METGAISTVSPASLPGRRHQSPGSEIGHRGSEFANSLRRIFEIFSFLGDSDRRPGSIGTAWREPQSYRGRDLKNDLGASEIAKALKIGRASVYRALLSAP